MAGKKSDACAQAEEVIRRLTERLGHLVDSPALSSGWSDVSSYPLPADAGNGRLSRLLRSALADGRVRSVKAGRRTYFGPSERPDLLPPPTSREYNPATLECCTQAEGALHQAVMLADRMVSAAEIRGAWREIDASSVPRAVRTRTFGPAIADGRVRVKEFEGRTFYAPASMPGLHPPPFVSDAARIREAVRRATETHRSRVPCWLIEAEVDGDPNLALVSDLTVGQLVSMAFTNGDLIGTKQDGHGTRYYGYSGGPTQVRPAVMREIDRRRQAIRMFWRVTAGRPFTTRSISRYCRGLDELTFPDDSEWGWTLALQNLERTGELVGIRSNQHRFVRWAVTDEWTHLTDEETALRLMDHRPSGSTTERLPSSVNEYPPHHDPGEVSRNDDVRRFLLERKRLLAAEQPTARAQDIVFSRPLSIDQLLAGITDAEERETWRTQINEATRLRPGMVRVAVTQVGLVGNRRYLDVEPAEASRRFFTLVCARRRATSRWIRRDYDEFLLTLEGDRQGTIPVGPIVLSAQLAQRVAELRSALEDLECAVEAVDLLEAEEDDVLHECDDLRSMVRQVESLLEEISVQFPRNGSTNQSVASGQVAVRVVAAGVGLTQGSGPKETVDPRQCVDGDLAADAFRDLALMTGVGRTATAYLPLLRPLSPHLKTEGGQGRRVEVWFDRIDALDKLCTMAGGAEYASFVGRGMPALRWIRDCRPFEQTLQSERRRAHPAAAVALGLLDDPESRRALIAYITRHLSGDQDTSLPATGEAVYGLAQLPFFGLAEALEAPARKVLKKLVRRHPDEGLCRTATRVLRAWDEEWSSLELLKKL